MTDTTTISSSSKPHGGRRALLRSLVLLLAMAPVSLASAQDIKRVTVISAREGAVVGTVTATGTVVAREEVPVHAEVDGEIVRAVLVEAGEYVETGTPLAEIDTTSADLALDRNTVELRRARMMIAQEAARLEKARVSEVEAGKELERSRSLMAKGASSERTFSEHENEHARAVVDLEVARQRLEVAHADLELIEHNRAEIERMIETSTVKAPTAGLVLSRNARTGLAVETGGAPLFVLAENGALELEVEVAEADLPLVRAGQPATFHLSGRPAPLTGTVRHRAARIDAASRMGRVRIALEDPAGLVVGAFVSGRIEVFARRSVLVPATAVRFTGDGATITTVEDGIVSKRSVEIGQVRGNLVEVIDGLATGVFVVLKAGSFLKPGEPATPAHLQYALPFENRGASHLPVSAPTTISRAD